MTTESDRLMIDDPTTYEPISATRETTTSTTPPSPTTSPNDDSSTAPPATPRPSPPNYTG